MVTVRRHGCGGVVTRAVALPRRQLVHPGDFVVCETVDEGGQPSLRIDHIELRGLNQGEGDRRGLATDLGASELNSSSQG